MRVELLYFTDCPNWTATDERLAEALQALGRKDVTVQRRLIETVEQAEESGFIGSPSIRINGTDPFASGDERVGLACRIYSTPEGLRGSPTTAQLLEVLS